MYMMSSVFAGFFSDADSEMAKIFGKVAAALSSDLKFAHTSVKAILDKYGYKELVYVLLTLINRVDFSIHINWMSPLSF